MNVAVFGGTCYIKLHIHGERKQKHHATVLKQKKEKRNPEVFLPIVGFLISEKQFFGVLWSPVYLDGNQQNFSHVSVSFCVSSEIVLSLA